MRLTKESVDAAERAAARYILWDSELKGFGLRVEPSGSKTYIVRYRVGGGRRGTRRQYKVGETNTLTPTQARVAAKAALAIAATGGDPQAEKVEARKTLTVAELCDIYARDGVATKKATTNALDQMRINGFIKRRLGAKKITEVTKGDVERLMIDINAGKLKGAPLSDAEAAHVKQGGRLPPGRLSRGGKTSATKAVKILSAIYSFAIAGKYCAENPCDGVKTFPDEKRERFLTGGEIAKLGEVLTAAAADPRHVQHVAILRLLLLTGARKNEIARLRQSEIKDGYLQLEDSKTGRRAIALGAAAQKVLAEVSLNPASPWVFPDPRDPAQPVATLDFAWVGFRKVAGLERTTDKAKGEKDDGVHIHDLRHTFASFGVQGGASLYLVGKLLGHAHAATTQRYAHLGDDPVKAAAHRISAAVAMALGGADGADVRPLKGGAR